MDSTILGITTKVTADVQRTVQSLNVIWREIGIQDDDILDRLGNLYQHVKHLLEDSLAGEVEMRDRLVKGVDDCTAELDVLSRELDIEVERPPEELSILAKEELLRTKVHELTALKVSRRRELKALRAKQRPLCTRLAMPPYRLDNKVPSKSDLQKLQEHVQMLTAEEGRRESRFSTLRAEVLELLNELATSPKGPLQAEIVSTDPASFELSAKTLEAVDACLQELKKTHAERLAEVTQLRRQLSELWRLLDVPQDEQEAFTSGHPGLGEDVLNALKGELARCQALKLGRLQEFAQRLRQELIGMYVKCGVPERKYLHEGACEAEDCTEEKLKNLEVELTHAKTFYNENAEIMEKVARREVLWSRLLEFEKKGQDPDRYNNRGGNLLREERERKRLEKELPRLEQEIQAYIAAHNDGHSSLFKEWSAAFTAHLEAQYAIYHEDKENERLAREARRNMSTPGTSRSAKRGASPAAYPSKFFRLGTSGASSATLRSATPGSVASTPRSVVRKTKTANRRRSLRRDAKKKSSVAASAAAGRQEGDATLSTTASSTMSFRVFTAGLNSDKRRPSTRSTLLPSTEPGKAAQKYERTLSVAKAGRRLQF